MEVIQLDPAVLITAIRESFIGAEQVYMNGSCIMFFKIMQTVYPSARPYWNADTKHMVTKIGDDYYDITGKVYDVRGYILDEEATYCLPVAVAFPQKKEQKKRLHTKQKLF